MRQFLVQQVEGKFKVTVLEDRLVVFEQFAPDIQSVMGAVALWGQAQPRRPYRHTPEPT